MDAPYLLDCNILIAICDEDHIAHRTANNWFIAIRPARFATCPISQMSLLRYILRMVPRPTFQEAKESLRIIESAPGHEFWPDFYDCLSLPDKGIIGHGHVTDAYLVNLAKANGGRVATLDRRMADVFAPTAFLVS